MSSTNEILKFDRWEKRLLRFVRKAGKMARIRQIDFSSPTKTGQRWPIYLLEIGKPSAFKRHTVSIVSGVHGLETIAIRIHLDLLKILLNRKNHWFSKELADGKLGIYSIPILNPAGVAMGTRANGKGVDLNRNSGVDAEGAMPFFGGHRISPALPYYRGKTLQRESRALFSFYRNHIWPLKQTVHTAIDLHSGYGSENFLWWPYSYSKRPVYQHSAFSLFAQELKKKHTDYRIEPMSHSYQTHGDLWDKALLDFEISQSGRKQNKQSLFLPLTLEIGTWQELKKNPLKILNKRNIFNPSPVSRKAFLQKHRQLLWDIIHFHTSKNSQKSFLHGK